MKLEVVVSAKQANPVYTGFPRNGQGKRDDFLDPSNPDWMDEEDWTKVECKNDEPFSDDCKYDVPGGRCTRDCDNGHCGHQVACSQFPVPMSDK